MKRLLFSILLSCICTLGLKAQEIIVPDGYVLVDSIIYRPSDALDSTLIGKSVTDLVTDSGNIGIQQSWSIIDGMNRHIQNNRGKSMAGYRVRIFFDNKQDSRSASEAALHRFLAMFPGIQAYRSFTNPFFKVTVGDFRTRSEAAQLLHMLKGAFPSAFIVKEQINYPAVDRTAPYIIDTVKVIRPAGGVLSTL